MQDQTLFLTLNNWVVQLDNGIKQRSEEWKKARILTIGGSSMATIIGKNPYNSIHELLCEKVGIGAGFKGNIKTQWGVLFEDVVKKYVELTRKCTVLGDDLYVLGSIPHTSYSPDGLAVMDIDGRQEVVLLEFKCPFSRMPTKNVPNYYLPQIYMGLDLLGIPTVGLFIEAVIRRCTWPQLGNNPEIDGQLDKSHAVIGNPIAYGILGLYIDNSEINEINSGKIEQFLMKYADEYGIDPRICVDDNVNSINDQANNQVDTQDLGDSSCKLFLAMMDLLGYGVSAYYGELCRGDDTLICDTDLLAFESFCSANNHVKLGILPYKILKVSENFIKKIPGYVANNAAKIKEIIDVVVQCLQVECMIARKNIINDYCGVVGFSDEYF